MIASEDMPPPAAPIPRPRVVWGICAVLTALTLLIFGQAVHYGFISFDDDRYVDHNPALTAGLSVKGLEWAFTTNLTRLSESAEYWEPLTLLSRLADYEVYGFRPGGHHLTSLLFHLATGLALFGALRRLTGATWRSALVAALFLVHPMHVEPVLWLSARKDLVNGLFFVLTLWAYAWYAARPGWRRYLLVFAAALAANMGKPMAVSLPFVLLLLDVWPLRRISWGDVGAWRRATALVGEKTPLLVLTFGVAALAYIVQRDIGALAGADVMPLPWRVGNATLAIGTYVAKAIVPVDLAFFYPHPGKSLNLSLVAAAAFGILLFTGVALRQWRARPWLAVGWFWFLVVLAPVAGVIQIGDQALADRYSYLAFIGLFVAIVWQGAQWVSSQTPKPAEGGGETGHSFTGGARQERAGWWLAGAIVGIMGFSSFLQVQTWRSSETVFRHALEVTDGNYVAHYNLGAVLWEEGRRQEAMQHFQEAARIREPFLRYQLAAAEEAVQRGAYGEAIPRLTRVLMITPWNSELHLRLATLLALNHEPGKALMELDTALKYRPDWLQPRVSIAAILIREGQGAKATKILQGVLEREPGNAEAQALIQTAQAGP